MHKIFFIESHYEHFKEKKGDRPHHVRSFGYVEDLIAKGIPDPIAYYTEVVKKEELDRQARHKKETRPRAFHEQLEKNIGYFLLHSLIEELEVKEVIDILSGVKRFQFSIYDMITQLIYTKVIYPCPKAESVSDVFPLLYRSSPISEDQVYDRLCFIGGFYNKYIELFNRQYERFYKRDYSKVFFDYTKYFIEIDLPKGDKQKEPSNENLPCPIIGQALLLDADLVPLGMQLFPGNEFEEPTIRKNIEKMKQKYNVNGKAVQAADKGQNCARNIYAAVKETNDGYIFSKSVHGNHLSKEEKDWVISENSSNGWTDYKDSEGNVLYRMKSCIDDFEYSFDETDPDKSEQKKVTFTVREKRVVSYTPDLAKKQPDQIERIADNAANCISFKKASEEDLKMAEYNLMVTSEINMPNAKIVEACHGIKKIEEYFRITKSFLDAGPAYLQKEETIYGHFLICYLSLFLLQVLEMKCFKSKVNSCDIINFIRDFKVTKLMDDSYINLSKNRDANYMIKDVTGIVALDALYLTDKEIDALFDKTKLIDPLE